MKKLKYGLWDNDGVLFHFTRELRDDFWRAARITMRQVVDPDLSDEEIREIISSSREKYGDTYAGLVAEGYDEKELTRSLYSHLDNKLIKPNIEIIKSFRKSINEGLKHGMLTHGVWEWVSRSVPQVGLCFVFKKANCITADQSGSLKKHRHPEIFDYALETLGFPAEETFF